LIAVAHERHGFRGDAGLLEFNHHHFGLRPANTTAGVLIVIFRCAAPRVAARSPMRGASVPATEAAYKTREVKSRVRAGSWRTRFSRSSVRQRVEDPPLDPVRKAGARTTAVFTRACCRVQSVFAGWMRQSQV